MGGSYRNDVLLFDTNSEKVSEVANGGQIKFVSSTNACIAASDDKVVALV